MEPNDQTSPRPAGSQTPRKLWFIAIAVFVVVVIIPLILLFSLAHDGSTKTGGGSSLKDVALADDAKVDLRKLPSGQTLFFTMMQRTARQTLIGGEYGEGYHDDSQNNDIITRTYREDNLRWQQGAVAFDYADLPWDPAPVGGFSLTRCLSGSSSIYTSYVAAPDWKPESAQDSKQACDVSVGVIDGKTNIDDLLAGGISRNQATVWVDLLAASKDSKSHQPLFDFGSPKVTTLDGKRIIAVDFKINRIQDSTYCTITCGMNILKVALQKAQVDPDKIGYAPELLDNSAQGTYYIHPATLLPVRSVVSTFANGKPSDEYRRQFRFTASDLSRTSTAQPATTPELINGFTELKDDTLTPPPSH